MDRALEILKAAPPDVMNHNLETVPRLYKQARPGSDYHVHCNLLQALQGAVPGRADQERADGRPGRDRRGDPRSDARHARARHRHADDRPVPRAVGAPLAGAALCAPRHVQGVRAQAQTLGFTHAAVGALVRSSYHADQQALAPASSTPCEAHRARGALKESPWIAAPALYTWVGCCRARWCASRKPDGNRCRHWHTRRTRARRAVGRGPARQERWLLGQPEGAHSAARLS